MNAVVKIFAVFLLLQADLSFSWLTPKLAEPGEFPFQAALMWKASPIASHFTSCTGAILNEFWILTSAYCISFVPDLGYNYIKVGNHIINLDDQYVQILQIEKLIYHEKYPGIYEKRRIPVLANLAYYDIGLIKTQTAIVFNDRVKPVRLPKANNWLLGNHKLDYNLVISGYGLFAYHLMPEHQHSMRTVSLPVVPNKVCTESIQTVFRFFQMGEMQMCTRPLDGNIAGCIGNWGGPLVQYENKGSSSKGSSSKGGSSGGSSRGASSSSNDEGAGSSSNNTQAASSSSGSSINIDRGEAIVVGIQGWSTAVCNTNGLAPVYTRVGYFVNWIKKKMKEN